MNDKILFRIITAVSVVVFLVVILLNKRVFPVPDSFPQVVYSFPTINAFINGSCFCLLLFSLYQIKQKNIALHKKINVVAFILSSLFLVFYITYHWLVPETIFPKDNPLRPIYLAILISHIILAALVLPLILLSFYRGIQMQVALHKKIVRWSYPIWLYVTLTGVIVYLMLSPYYTH